MQDLVASYQQAVSECDSVIEMNRVRINVRKATITQRDKEFSALPWWKKPFFFPARSHRNAKDKSAITSLESGVSQADRKKSAEFNDMILRAGRRLMLETPDVSGAMLTMEADHAQIKELQASLSEVYHCGKKALTEIHDAQSSVSSAQTMEVFDAFTSNKAISVMSTMSNSSASGDISNAKRAVSAFNTRLQTHQKIVADLQHSTAIEYMDLSFDLFFGGALDLAGSVMSLFSLSSASSQLDDAECKVKQAIREIEPSYQNANQKLKQHEVEMLDFKKQQRLKVIPFLAAHDIDVTEDDVLSIDTLYANA